MQAASAAQSDPFVKIRGLIDQMITKLQNQAAEEATHDAFCKEETSKSTKNRDVKTGLVSKHQTRIDKAKSATAQLKQEVQDLQDEIGEITNSKSKAAEIRNKENAEYKKASADYKASAEAVTHAIEVMREFYGDKQASLLQSSVPAPAFGGARSDSSNGIVSFLEVAQSDFTRLLAEAEATESEAADAFQKLSQDAQVSLATKKADVKGKESEIKSLHVALSNSENDLETSSKELDAVLEYLEKLRPQCTSKAQTYEERKAKRDAEIAGLKDALEILNGEAPAFLQRK
jgi:chromosome segregation ATPase